MIYYKKNILKETQNIVFFDIDGTFSSSIESLLHINNEKYMKFKCSYYQDWKTIKLVDFKFLNHSSIALFANFLRQTNSKAVCISSWNIRGMMYKDSELYMKELQESFESICSYFPNSWLLGFSGGGGGDRFVNSIIPFIKKTNFNRNYIAIDDGGFEYSDQSNTVIVDGKKGFDYQDYEKALKLFNIHEKAKLFRE